jgi:hypothetical protein
MNLLSSEGVGVAVGVGVGSGLGGFWPLAGKLIDKKRQTKAKKQSNNLFTAVSPLGSFLKL